MSNRSHFKNLPAKARSAVVLFGAIGVCGLVFAATRFAVVDYPHFGLMLFLAVVTAHTKVRLIGGSSLSLLTTVVLISLMMLGTKAAIFIGVCGVLVQCALPPRRFVPHHLIFNTGMIALTVSLSGFVYYWIVPMANPTLSDQFVGSLAASLLYYIGNSVCVSLIIGFSTRKSAFRVWHDNFLYTAPSFFIGGILAVVALRLAASFPTMALVLAVFILSLCYYSYRVYLVSLENEKKHAIEMAELFNSTLSTLALAIDAKDRNTHGHTQRVQRYARAIAEAMRLDENEIKAIAAAALLHDIGKLAVPEYILSKTGPLTPEEMRKMRLHPQLGAEIISNIKFPYPVANSIEAHHERYDGTGYPKGLKGKEIPLGARVLAVADVFDAYTSDRADIKATKDEALNLLREGAGTSFDPDIVAVWEKVCRDVVKWESTTASSAAYSDIQRATSEIKILESLSESITGLTAVEDIASAACSVLENSIPRCKATLKAGQRYGAPVTFNGAVIATISIHRPNEPLTDDESRLVTAVAERISGSLYNAIALEAARREATVDKLTGLANRRAFDIMCASLADRRFSIVLIDVNSFKAVNDNFGHRAGDATLVRIATHLQAAFTNVELICRLGGDEFLVLSFADRPCLRMQIRNFRGLVLSDPAHEAYRKLSFGVSCGLATKPADAHTLEEVLQRADERMYAIKLRTKNWTSRALTA